ncbi:MAG: MobF family relaxase [Acidimicrobiales bacterium]
MLHVVRLTEGTGRYYLADLAAELELPTPEQPCATGTWRGEVAAGLGLAGPVAAGDLGAVLSGANPRTGRALGSYPAAVHGFDLTFSAAKSVSVVFAMSDADRASEVLAAHREAVGSALDYLDARAVSVRRGSGDDRHVEPARGLVSALFTHGVSRALDPHLHSHVVVANLTHGVDGRWSALDGRGLFAHGRAAGALYDAELRHLLSVRLGVSWSRRQHGRVEVDGIDPVLLGALSRRRAEIRQHLYDHARSRGDGLGDVASRRANAVAWAATRGPKTEIRSGAALRAQWRRRASDAGWSGDLGPEPAPTGPLTSGRFRPVARRSSLDEYRFEASLRSTGKDAVARRDAVAAWAGALAGGAPARKVVGCIDAVVPWGDGVGVAEGSQRVGAVVAPPHLLRALGPRPASPDSLARWLDGAASIDRYRERWLSPGAREPLGVRGTSTELSVMPVRRLAEHLSLTRELAEIRRQLGLDMGHDVDRSPRGVERSLGLG